MVQSDLKMSVLCLGGCSVRGGGNGGDFDREEPGPGGESPGAPRDRHRSGKRMKTLTTMTTTLSTVKIIKTKTDKQKETQRQAHSELT